MANRTEIRRFMITIMPRILSILISQSIVNTVLKNFYKNFTLSIDSSSIFSITIPE